MNLPSPAAMEKPLAQIVAPAIFLLAGVVWTLLVLFSLWTQREQLNRMAIELARSDAIANLKKDMAIRKWASEVGGVFIADNDKPALDSLSEQERLLAIRNSGEVLRLVSLTPIHILLGIQAVSNKEYGAQERLTSLQLHNPANAPDEWEKKALQTLQKGGDLVAEAMPKKKGHGLMRVMIPMRMEEECLECHRETLVPVGGLRGGAAISVDLNTYWAAQEPAWRTIQYWHGSIWLAGIVSLIAYWNFLRRRAREHALIDAQRRETEAAFSAMAEGAMISDAEGKILWVNDAFCRIFGYTREEVLGQTPRLLKSGRHDADFYRAMWAALEKEGQWRGEIWNRRKNGEIFPEALSIQALKGPHGETLRYISVFSDISERKKNEEALEEQRRRLEESERQLRELAAFLQTVREEERTRIARELHDELGQTLTALRLDLRWLQNRQGNNDAVAERIAAALAVVEHGIVSLRRISEDLRPAMLDSLGLAAALEHHVEQFQQRSGIACRLSLDRDEYDLDERTATTVFRVVQEALTNVARHAHARLAEIDLRCENDTLVVTIRDDGCGFVANTGKKTFGLLGMRERVAMIGGRLEIDSRLGEGVTITCRIPLQKETSP